MKFFNNLIIDLTTQNMNRQKGYASLGNPIMKYVIAVAGTIVIKTADEVKIRSARKAASTEYVLFDLSCLNNALALLR